MIPLSPSTPHGDYPACSLEPAGGVRLILANRNIPSMLSQVLAVLTRESLNVEEHDEPPPREPCLQHHRSLGRRNQRCGHGPAERRRRRSDLRANSARSTSPYFSRGKSPRLRGGRTKLYYYTTSRGWRGIRADGLCTKMHLLQNPTTNSNQV